MKLVAVGTEKRVFVDPRSPSAVVKETTITPEQAADDVFIAAHMYRFFLTQVAHVVTEGFIPYPITLSVESGAVREVVQRVRLDDREAELRGLMAKMIFGMATDEDRRDYLRVSKIHAHRVEQDRTVRHWRSVLHRLGLHTDPSPINYGYHNNQPYYLDQLDIDTPKRPHVRLKKLLGGTQPDLAHSLESATQAHLKLL